MDKIKKIILGVCVITCVGNAAAMDRSAIDIDTFTMKHAGGGGSKII